jgi:Stress responsive A/B Barrel Domain
MKKIYVILSAILFFASCSPDPKSEIVQSEPETSEPKSVLRHVVLFKFTDTSTPEDVKKIEDAFLGLPGKISQIKAYEWGTNSSPENLNQGLTHCFFVTFHSDKDRDDYLVHPDHQAFVEVLKPHLDKVTVVDYWTK